MTKPDFRVERNLQKRGIWPVAGIDEAGRGPLAGPVAAAAVILDPRKLPRGLNDSKRLTPSEREHLYEEIMRHAIAVAVAFASAAELRSHVLLAANEAAASSTASWNATALKHPRRTRRSTT